MLIHTARDIPDALKDLASDLRRLGENAWADRITLTISMRKEGRELAKATFELLAELARTSIPRESGYTHRVMALQHATAALQIGNRLKPSTLQHAARNTVSHRDGFQVRKLDLKLIYREGSRTITVPLEATDGGSICRLDQLQWDGASAPLAAAARDVIQQRIIAALLFLDAPCRIYCQ
jgi:hypothetical protein